MAFKATKPYISRICFLNDSKKIGFENKKFQNFKTLKKIHFGKIIESKYFEIFEQNNFTGIRRKTHS